MNSEHFIIGEGVRQPRLDLVTYTTITTFTQISNHPVKEIMTHPHHLKPLKNSNNLYLTLKLHTTPTLITIHLPPPHITIQTDGEHAILNSTIYSLNLGNNETPPTPFHSPSSTLEHPLNDTIHPNHNLNHLSPNHPHHNPNRLTHNPGQP